MRFETAEFLKNRLPYEAKIAIVLGSGMGRFTETLTDTVSIPYTDIPHFPVSTVKGHQGRLILGKCDGIPVLCMSGRFHYYEGYFMQEIAFPIHVFRTLGVETIILTNAAGGIREDFSPGTLMLMSDHLKFSLDSPLRGANDDALGERFFDVSDCYSKELRQIAKEEANRLGISLSEGVYAYMGGPQYETPAEIKMLRTLGADAVGMSTVPEALAAAHDGVRVLGISIITNQAAGLGKEPLSHNEVLLEGEKAEEKMCALLSLIIRRMEEDA